MQVPGYRLLPQEHRQTGSKQGNQGLGVPGSQPSSPSGWGQTAWGLPLNRSLDLKLRRIYRVPSTLRDPRGAVE